MLAYVCGYAGERVSVRVVLVAPVLMLIRLNLCECVYVSVYVSECVCVCVCDKVCVCLSRGCRTGADTDQMYVCMYERTYVTTSHAHTHTRARAQHPLLCRCVSPLEAVLPTPSLVPWRSSVT